MELGLLQEILPEFLLDHFDIISYKNLGEVSTKEMILEIHLDEKNRVPPGQNSNEYESKGFMPRSRVQDFPIRGKAVYLMIRRRKWRHKQTRKEIRSDYTFIAEGSRITEELSAFLKETGRY